MIGLAKLDRPLLDALAQAGPDTQRSIARWAARRAYDVAGLSALDWVAPSLAAMERGEDLPAPFDDQVTVWRLLYGRSRIRSVHVSVDLPGSAYDIPRNIDPRAAAVPALFAAVHADPLKAAVDAVYSAAVTFSDDYRRFLHELCIAFPAVG